MMNIIFSGNYKVFDGMLTALLSIVKHTKRQLNVLIFTMDLPQLNPNFISVSDSDISVLQNVVKEVNAKSTVTKVDLTETFTKEMINSVNIETGYTPYTFLRLFADMMEIVPDKALYLDVDLMANDDISKLYDIDITDYEFAGSRDYYGKVFFYPTYLNAGVLLLNMKKIRETKMFEKCRHLLNIKKVFLTDQTVLNKFATKKLILHRRFNEQKKMKKDTVIRHFAKTIKFFPWFHTQNIKQWQIELMHKKLKCHEFDDVLDKYIEIKKANEKN